MATYTYDPVYKRLVGVNYSDGSSESYTYEPVSGRRLTATNENGTTTYEYYPVTGRLFRETVPAGQSVEYQWDANGNKKAEIRPGETLTYRYDKLGRISTITRSGDNAIAGYTYLPNGREHTFTDFNGNVKTNEFDILGRLTATYTVNMHGTPLGNYSYTLDALGNRTEIWEGTRNIVYSYDDLNRLTSETVIDMGNVVFDASYTYDPTGNRLTKTTLTDTISYSYDANDRVTLETVTDPEDLPLYSRAYTYDSNGNTLSDDTKTYTYDSKNRLISFTDAADTGIYTYDTAGRRLSKTYGGSTTEYLYCTTCRYAQVLEERDDLGNITAEYYIGNDLISKEDTTQELSYLYDGHGSVRRLINKYGSISAQYSYDAYGILLYSSGPSSEDNDFRYSGEQYDSDLDQYYLRARYYNQSVGRFSSMDSWGGNQSNPITLNKYLYGNGNPVMNYDPTGKWVAGVAITLGIILAVNNVMAQTAEPVYSIENICCGCNGYFKGQKLFTSMDETAIDAENELKSRSLDLSIRYDLIDEIWNYFEFATEISWYKPKPNCKNDCFYRHEVHGGVKNKSGEFLYMSETEVTPLLRENMAGLWHTHPSKIAYPSDNDIAILKGVQTLYNGVAWGYITSFNDFRIKYTVSGREELW